METIRFKPAADIYLFVSKDSLPSAEEIESFIAKVVQDNPWRDTRGKPVEAHIMTPEVIDPPWADKTICQYRGYMHLGPNYWIGPRQIHAFQQYLGSIAREIANSKNILVAHANLSLSSEGKAHASCARGQEIIRKFGMVH